MLAARLIPLPVQNLAAAVVLGKPKNPGPRRRTVRPPGDLDSAWRSFLAWVSCHLSVDPVSLFVCCPILAAMALRASGNHLYCNGGSKHTFRHTLVGAQRAILTLRGCLAPAWEILSRWEAAEPTIHRTPLPEPLLRAMICIAWLGGFRRWCGCALLAFYGMARIGEVLSCERRHLLLPEDLFDFSPSVFLRLDSSKTSLRGRPKVHVSTTLMLRPSSSSRLPISLPPMSCSLSAKLLFALAGTGVSQRWVFEACMVTVTPGGFAWRRSGCLVPPRLARVGHTMATAPQAHGHVGALPAGGCSFDSLE